MDPSPLIEVLEDSSPIVGGGLDAYDLGPSSNHADGGHDEPWLGLNPIDPYKFNNHKQRLVT